MRELLFSVGPKDFTETHIFGSGAGGQHRNKNATGVRLVHRDSGAVGEATDSKSQKVNRRNAFLRLTKTPTFQAWLKAETARHVDVAPEMEEIRAERARADRTYTMHRRNEVVDHRTGFRHPNPQAVLDGDLDGFHEAALRHRVRSR